MGELTRSKLCLACQSIFSGRTKKNEDGEIEHHGLEALEARANRGCHLCLTVFTSIDPAKVHAFQTPAIGGDDTKGFVSLTQIAKDQARLRFRYAKVDRASLSDVPEKQKLESEPPRRRGTLARDRKNVISFDRRFTISANRNTVLSFSRRITLSPNTSMTSLPPSYTSCSKVSVSSSCSDLADQPIEIELILMSPRYAVEPGVKTIDDSSESTDSDDSVLIAKQWLYECCSNHIKCSAPSHDSLWKPTHLLDVSIKGPKGAQGLKLVDGVFVDPLSEYVTLSHCWGKTRGIRLHKGTLAALRQGVAVEDLPKTFAEAAIMTERLGFRYLWIDALCVMHDNEALVLNEMMQMHKIYAEASLNIAATSAKDDSAGLIYERKALALQPVTIRAEGLDIQDGMYKCLRLTTWQDLVDSSPLSKRAWVLQERGLAKRTLHFTCNEVFWECQQMCCSEVFPTGLPATIEMPTSEVVEPFNKKEHHQRNGNWNQLVKMYCNGQLTYSSDKLLAIAGLAKQYMTRNRLRDSDYLAGLWRPHMPQSLLWRVEKGKRPMMRYRAPTWSWASIDGAVTYQESTQPIKETCIEVVDVMLKHKPDVFGFVEDGYLTVRGSMAQGLLQRTEEYWGSTTCTIQCPKTWVDLTVASFDERLHKLSEKGAISEQMEVYLLPVLDLSDHVEGLILCSNLRQGEFRRLGIFEVWRSEQINWNRFRKVMKGDPNMSNYEQRLDHVNEFWYASDYTYTINIV